MKNKARRVLTLALAMVTAFSVMSFSVMAEEETTVAAKITDTEFFAGTGAGEGIIKTSTDVDGDGDSEDYYVAYGAGNMYTSLDGIAWDRRLPAVGLRSLAYGGDKFIGVMAPTEERAYIANSYLKGADYVYNKVEGVENTWVSLRPNIYYDEFSGYYFCHGMVYTYTSNDGSTYVKSAYSDIDLFYTDGTIGETTYGTQKVSALTWKKVPGDYTDNWQLYGTYGTSDVFNTLEIEISGDGNGNVLVLFGDTDGAIKYFVTNEEAPTATAVNSSGQGSRNASLIRVTKNDSNACVVEGIINTTSTFNTGYMTSAGNLIVWEAPGSSKGIRIGTVTNSWSRGELTVSRMVKNPPAVKQITENNGTIWAVPKTGEIADGVLTLYATTLTDIGSGSSPVAKQITLPVGSEAATVVDVDFDKNGDLIILTNNSAANEAYMYSVDVETLAATALTANSTYTGIQANTEPTNNVVYGHSFDTGIAARREDTTGVDGYTKYQDINYTYVSGNEGNYFTAARYPKVADNTPLGTYNLKMWLTVKNQPSIFLPVEMAITVVPYFTTSLNSGTASPEVTELTLAQGTNNIKVKFADQDSLERGSKTDYKATYEDLVVIAAVYDKTTGEMKIADVRDHQDVYTDTAGETGEIDFTLTGNAGDTAKIFIWKNLTTLAPLYK